MREGEDRPKEYTLDTGLVAKALLNALCGRKIMIFDVSICIESTWNGLKIRKNRRRWSVEFFHLRTKCNQLNRKGKVSGKLALCESTQIIVSYAARITLRITLAVFCVIQLSVKGYVVNR